MYQKFFNLVEIPYSLSPDPRYLYLTSQHREAIAKCQYIIKQKGGLAVVYGDIGSGKTSITRRLFTLYKDNSKFQIAMIVNPNPGTKRALSEKAFLRNILAEFEGQLKRSHGKNMIELQELVTQTFQANKILLLLIDEAQQLSKSMIEVIRSMLNFETDKEKLIQIILFGQNELATTLDTIPAVKSRVAMFGALSSLNLKDTREMIQFRWKVAGGGNLPFSLRSVEEIWSLSQGLPRGICKLCNESLIKAFVAKEKKVTLAMVKLAAKELRMKKKEGKNGKK